MIATLRFDLSDPDDTLTDDEREAVRTAVRMVGDPSPIQDSQADEHKQPGGPNNVPGAVGDSRHRSLQSG